jgi:recombination DNA repair RAD52 pathway protein
MNGTESWGAFTADEESRINEQLRTGLPKEFVKHRPGAGGKKIDYLEGGAQLEIANHGEFVPLSFCRSKRLIMHI